MNFQMRSNSEFSQAQDLVIMPQNSDRLCLSSSFGEMARVNDSFGAKPIGIKHPHTHLLKWHTIGTCVGKLSISLNNIRETSKMVTIHGRRHL